MDEDFDGKETKQLSLTFLHTYGKNKSPYASTDNNGSLCLTKIHVEPAGLGEVGRQSKKVLRVSWLVCMAAVVMVCRSASFPSFTTRSDQH